MQRPRPLMYFIYVISTEKYIKTGKPFFQSRSIDPDNRLTESQLIDFEFPSNGNCHLLVSRGTQD